jgi:hypothetical protein
MTTITGPTLRILEAGQNGLKNPSFETLTNDKFGGSTVQDWTPMPTARAKVIDNANAQDRSRNV